MSDHKAFMERALELSRREMPENGAAPFGVVAVKDGNAVGKGVNHMQGYASLDATACIAVVRDPICEFSRHGITNTVLFDGPPASMCHAGAPSSAAGATAEKSRAVVDARVPALARQIAEAFDLPASS